MRIVTKPIKTRKVFNQVWEMQATQNLITRKWQTTYYNGADEVIWSSGTETTRESAIRALDSMVDKFFGSQTSTL
jgi:hypothetical protein